MPRKICNQLGCNELISMKERYCSLHIINIAKHRNKSYDKSCRNKVHAKFYNSKEWRTIRDEIMASTGGLCRSCKDNDMTIKAAVVDHIIPIEKDYDLRLNKTNLQPLCHQCHNKKTAADIKQ